MQYFLLSTMRNRCRAPVCIPNTAFRSLIERNDLPQVVFHSLRHSSITYKLKLNGGDVKAVQGDSGHAQVKMVKDVYSHILDDDRRNNAQLFENAFYSSAGRETAKTEARDDISQAPADAAQTDAEMLLKLQRITGTTIPTNGVITILFEFISSAAHTGWYGSHQAA